MPVARSLRSYHARGFDDLLTTAPDKKKATRTVKAFVVGISESIFRMKKRKESHNYPINSAIIICTNLCQVANRVRLGCVLDCS